ncbi:MAG TPA: carboxyl transferase domain-containing protein [Usitatibacter sp.]|nr:carboxyl transferase domain-containing protein [Usitatibacter sp.]
MSEPSASTLLGALREAIAFEAAGAAAGNLTIGRGTLDGRALHVAVVENFAASGSLGRQESQRLATLFGIVATEKSPLVLFLDSAGAKVSEGLGALGAFRHLFRAGLEAAFSAAPIAAVLGKNCYGGASMLAHLAPQRLFSPVTQLAMSGPSILASAAGVSALDEMFRAMAQASISPKARVAASSANAVWDGGDPSGWLREALAPRSAPDTTLRARHEALRMRLPKGADSWEPVRRRDLEKLYSGYEAREAEGVLTGHGIRETGDESFAGIVGKAPLGITRAWRFADAVWKLADDPPPRLEVYLDCATHAGRLEDEKAVLTEFIVDMACALFALGRRGTKVGLTVLGKAGGGVYVALAGPASRVASIHGADIQVLPGSAVAAILGSSTESAPVFDEYRKSGVADEEIKLGIVPGTK